MGSQDSIISNNTPEPIENLELTHLGPLTLMKSNSSYCLLKIYSFTDNFLMEERLRKFKTRVTKIGENLHVLNVYSVNKLQKKEICANNYQLHAYLQRPSCTLQQTIARRLREKRNFSEQQLFSFLSKVIGSLIYIQDNGLKNILLDSQAILFCDENIKVLDSGLAYSKTYHQLLESKEKGINYCKSSIYLAPELLKELQELNYDPYVSPKADIFSLGMLLLEMVTLQSMQGYYDYTRAEIDYDSLIHRLSRINHSLPLKTLIAEMLEYDPEERIGLVSLKQKIQKLQRSPQTQSTQINRSKSSKLLKEILSQSRRSGSVSKHGEGSGGISRQPSTERKSNSKIEIHCNSIKKLDFKDSQSKQLQKQQQVKKEANKKENKPLHSHLESNIDQVQFKNLVKNRLIKEKDKNKQNNKSIADCYKAARLIQQPKIGSIQTRILMEKNSNRFDQSMKSNKFDSSFGSKMFEGSTGFNKPSLGQLVEQSGLKTLLKLQHLNQSNFKRSCPQSVKNTSRFGNVESAQHFKEKGAISKPQNLRKISQIYIKQEDDRDVSRDQPLITVREPISRDRQLQKVMTFNNKQFLISARSVENSVDQIPPNAERDERLVFSPINSNVNENQSCEIGQSPSLKMTIKDVPVVVSQQKVYQQQGDYQNYGKLQRHFNLIDCAKSIQQDTISNDNNLSSASKVLESFKPRTNQQEYRSHGIVGSKVEEYSRQNSCFLKKAKGKKPQLNIQLNDDDEINYDSVKVNQPRGYQQNETPYQKLNPYKQNIRKLDNLYKTTQSIQQLSNFASISPIQDSKEYNNDHYYYQHKAFEGNNQEYSSVNPKTTTLANGDAYEGQLNSLGQPHGNGVLKSYKTGVQYSGTFQNGRFHGFGTLVNLNYHPNTVDHRLIDLSIGYWTKFEGEFDNGAKNGFGTIYFSEGQKFSGCLKRNIIQGYGCFYKKAGQLVSGLWSENQLRKA